MPPMFRLAAWLAGATALGAWLATRRGRTPPPEPVAEEGRRCPRCAAQLETKILSQEVAAPTGVEHETARDSCPRCGYSTTRSYSW